MRGTKPPLWLTESAQLAQKHTEKTSVVKPLEQLSVEGQPTKNHIAMIPLKMAEISNATAVFYIETDDKAILEEKFQKLQLIAGMLNYSEARFARPMR